MTKAIELSQLGNKLRVRSTGEIALGASADHQGGLLTVGDVDSPTFARAAVAIKARSSDASVGTANLYLEESSGAEGYYINVDADGALLFNNSGTVTTLKLDDTNNILVGKTTSSGLNAGCEFRPAGMGLFTRSGANPLQVRRLTDDGDLVEFYQDAGLIGSVGVDGTSLTISMAGSTGLKISSTGKVGIGNVDPANALHIKNASPVIRLESSASSYVGRNTIGQFQNVLYIECDNDNAISNSATVFSVDGSEELRINSDGQLIHGGVSNPADYDLVTGGSGYRSILLGSTTGATAAIIIDGAANGDGAGSDYASIEHNTNGEMRYKNRQNSSSGGAGHVFYTTNTDIERLRITSDGNVNIGNKNQLSHSSSVDSLQIGYALNLYEDSYTSGTDNYVVLGNNIYYNGGNKYMRNDEASRIMMQAGTFYFQHAATGTAGNAISFATPLRITSAGSAEFTGGSSPSGRNTRISQYGSLLVATTGELLANARCSIDSGNGTITTAGNGLFAVNTSTYQTGINLHTSSNLSTLTVYSNNSSTHRSLVVYDNAQSGDAKYRASINANGSASFKGSILASSVNLQSSSTSSWFQTGTSIASSNYVWAAKNSSSNTWHSGLQTDGDLYLGGNLAGTNNIALNGSNGSAWFSGGVGIGGYASANTMDKYEEGAYTPKLYLGTGTTEAAYNWRYGQYVRIGEVVHVWGAMGISGSVSSCSTAYIGNLPYNQLYDSNNFFFYTQLFGYTWASGYGDSGNTTRLFLQSYNGDGTKVLIVNGSSKQTITHAMIGSGQRFTFQFSYVVG